MGGKTNTVVICSKSIPCRKDFYAALKEPNETVELWLCRVKDLANSCCFGIDIDTLVLDKFITGLEAESIDYLCSQGECFTLDSSFKCIMANETHEVEIKEEISFDDPPPDTPCESETLLPELLIVDEDQIESDNGDSNFDDTCCDSDYVCSEYEEKLRREEKRKKATRRQNDKKPKLANIKSDEIKKTDDSTDINVSPKKRKYKKRAIKEKQTFECEICHFKCHHDCHLRRHKLTHLNEKSFICHMCGKGFNLFINLNAHIRRHVGFKPHSCDICKRSFMDKTRLKLHMRTHTGERHFGCSVCDKKFADRYYLKVHMRLHTGEKPFQCENCQKCFSQSSSLSTNKKKNCLINQMSGFN